MKKWQVQEAKNKFSEVVRKATEEGPQTVTRHGEECVVIVSAKDYKEMRTSENSLVEFMRDSPLSGVELDIERDKSTDRGIFL